MLRRSLPPQARSRGVTAVLGPTNTGKTHLAIERMLGHRQRHDRPAAAAARARGLPARRREGRRATTSRSSPARRRSSRTGRATGSRTVEAMPRDLDVAFVAVDEIQLAADLDRGHVFTDRLLNQRGREETLLIGAAHHAPAGRGADPRRARRSRRPRLSKLTFAGEKKITRLPRALRHRRLLGRGGLRHRRADPPPARRRGGGARARSRRAPATPRSSSTSPATSTTSSPPTPSAWASTSTSTTSPSPPTGSSTASASASSIPPSSARSPAAPAATCATAPSAPRAAARRSMPELVEALENHALRSGARPAMAQPRPRLLVARAPAGQPRRASPREHGLTRAPIGRGRARARDRRARGRHPRLRPLAGRGASGCGRSARCPDYRKVSPAGARRSRRRSSTAS